MVPIDLSTEWNLISRTIVPLIAQDNFDPGAGRQIGLGDVVQSLFFSPKVMKIGDQLVSVAAGVRYWADSPSVGSHG